MRHLIRRCRTAPVVATAAFAVLGVAWALSTPPGAAPDEPSHYIRMVGLARGDLMGDRVDPSTPPPGPLPSVEAAERMNREAGWYELPSILMPPGGCNAFRPEQPFSCSPVLLDAPNDAVISYHARYLPGAYVVPAAVSRVGDTMWQTMFLGRIGFLLQATVLFAVIACAVSARCRAVGGLSTGSAVVLAVAPTPLVLFLAGTLAPNGTEVLAVAAFTASALALGCGWSARWLWCAAVCAVVASWSRDLGAALVVAALVAVVLVEPSLVADARRRRREVRAPVALVLVGIVSATVWQLANKVSVLRWPASWGELAAGLSDVADAVPASIGLVGWLDTRVHRFVEVAWVVVAAVAAGAVLTRVATRVQRVVAAVAALTVLAGVELAIGLRAAGFGLQARFLLPIVAIGAIVLVMAPQRAAPWSRGVVRVALLGVAAGHLATLLRAAHRHANGIGQQVDFASPLWAPPGGWATSITVMLLGVALVALVPLGRRDAQPGVDAVSS